MEGRVHVGDVSGEARSRETGKLGGVGSRGASNEPRKQAGGGGKTGKRAARGA